MCLSQGWKYILNCNRGSHIPFERSCLATMTCLGLEFLLKYRCSGKKVHYLVDFLDLKNF